MFMFKTFMVNGIYGLGFRINTITGGDHYQEIRRNPTTNSPLTISKVTENNHLFRCTIAADKQTESAEQ